MGREANGGHVEADADSSEDREGDPGTNGADCTEGLLRLIIVNEDHIGKDFEKRSIAVVNRLEVFRLIQLF